MFYFRAEDLQEYMDLYTAHQYTEHARMADRMAKIRFAGISRVDFLTPSEDEMRLLKKADACRDLPPLNPLAPTICFIRKANVLMRGGNTYEGVFIYTDYTGSLYGPEGEEYNLKNLDIVGFTRNSP